MLDKSLIVIVGPTAVGKTTVSIELAQRLSCSIISADSRQLFKEMRIGTAKPSIDEMQGVKHYFVDDRSIEKDFSAGKFEREALEVLNKEFIDKNVSLLVGGSGLYIDALCLGLNDFPEIKPNVRNELNSELLEGGVEKLYQRLKIVDPQYAEEIEANNSQRIIRALEIFESSGKTYSSLRLGLDAKRNFNIYYIGLEMDRALLYERINTRMDQMIAEGLFEEAIDLINFRDKNALQTVGYNEVFMYQDGLIDKKEAIRLLKRNSRRYAKRQLTWFKRNDEIKWFHPDNVDKIYNYLEEKLHT
ncbi:MAG: tRNA (adenosine(37)-N6)-dimethylallyltransferase MiaA [Bacteroidetes bacterium]|nr:MAG: tRNA (adenosine(37)-N6)-dimethylallyltransferase MiaA [Bacteroidota bacterium]